MNKLIIIYIIIFSLLFVPPIFAKSSDLFIDHLTDLIWDDCNGKNIEINQPIIKYNAENQTFGLMKWPCSKEEINHTLFLLHFQWPYSKANLRQLIQLITEQPYRTYQGQCDGVYSMVSNTGWEGCGLLTSGNNKLNINFDTYYWNGVKVDVPSEDIKIASGQNSTIIETHGEMSPVTTGPYSPVTTGNGSSVTQQNTNITIAFGAGTFFGIILNFLLKYLYDIYKGWHSNRLPKKNSKK